MVSPFKGIMSFCHFLGMPRMGENKHVLRRCPTVGGRRYTPFSMNTASRYSIVNFPLFLFERTNWVIYSQVIHLSLRLITYSPTSQDIIRLGPSAFFIAAIQNRGHVHVTHLIASVIYSPYICLRHSVE